MFKKGRFLVDFYGNIIQSQRTIREFVVGGYLNIGTDRQRPQIASVLENVNVGLVREILAVRERELVQVVPQQVLEAVVCYARVAYVHRPQVRFGDVLEQMGETVEDLAAVVLVRLDERLAYAARQGQSIVEHVTVRRFLAQRAQVAGHVLEAQTEQRFRDPFLFVSELDRNPLAFCSVEHDNHRDE